MSGYCVQGTVGHKILSGAKKVEFMNRQVVEVKMAVEYMSFSAHADARGIMQLIQNCEPRNVLLVHDEAAKMKFLKDKIHEDFKIDCYFPAKDYEIIIFFKHSLFKLINYILSCGSCLIYRSGIKPLFFVSLIFACFRRTAAAFVYKMI